jgi:hypothetical protein
MEYTTKQRKQNYKDFMKHFEKLWLNVDKNGEYTYKSYKSMFKKRILSSGVEGVVSKAHFIDDTKRKKDVFVIKQIDLKKIKESKAISKKVLDAHPEDVYRIFYSRQSFNKPSMIEIISNTLLNQLVFQKICPNFPINYNWDYTNNKMFLFNELASYGDFDTWMRGNRTNEEWFNAFFQIMIGLLAMKRYFNMLHTDFHVGNILVQKVKKGGYWIYKLDNKRYIVPNLGYVFLIADFGFSWIPKKMYIPWHYKDRLSHVTKNGMHFYDIASFIDSVVDYKYTPNYFSSQIKKNFSPEELVVYPTAYYTEKYNKYKNRSNGSTYKNKLQEIKSLQQSKRLPTDIKKSYEGKNTTLADKIYQMFYVGNYDKIKNIKTEKFIYRYTKKTKIPKSQIIEKFSLDKKLNKEKLEGVFRGLAL